jgi:O-antigen ligase
LFLFIARGAARRQAVRALALGGVALFLLLGDPTISDRFLTTFSGSEERDQSAASRLDFWRAGLAMLADHPLGDGGNSFKLVTGGQYIAQVTGSDQERSLHNGYLEQATSWGVQGLLLHLLFIGGAAFAALGAVKRSRLDDRGGDALLGICLVVSAGALCVHSMFGSFLGNEWGFWLVALLLRYGDLYGSAVLSPVAQQEPALSDAARTTPWSSGDGAVPAA